MPNSISGADLEFHKKGAAYVMGELVMVNSTSHTVC